MKPTTLLAKIALLAATFTLFPAGALTVDEAYAALPMKHTGYDPAVATIPKQEAAGLRRFFAITDRAVVLRVETLRAHAASDAAGIKRSLQGFDEVVAELEKEGISNSLAPIRDKVVVALRQQQKFFAARAGTGMRVVRQEFKESAEVREASRQLHSAYRMMMDVYQTDAGRNRSAFAEHIKALDYYY